MKQPLPAIKLPTPYLKLAMIYSSRRAGNTCVQRAAALMFDMPADSVLVFGVLRGATPAELAQDQRNSPVPFIHAWVEHGGKLYAPTTIERTGGELLAIPAELYYRVNSITRTWSLPHRQFMTVARRWKLVQALKAQSDRFGDPEVADDILRAAGVRYVLSDRRTLLPAPDA